MLALDQCPMILSDRTCHLLFGYANPLLVFNPLANSSCRSFVYKPMPPLNLLEEKLGAVVEETGIAPGDGAVSVKDKA